MHSLASNFRKNQVFHPLISQPSDQWNCTFDWPGNFPEAKHHCVIFHYPSGKITVTTPLERIHPPRCSRNFGQMFVKLTTIRVEVWFLLWWNHTPQLTTGSMSQPRTSHPLHPVNLRSTPTRSRSLRSNWSQPPIFWSFFMGIVGQARPAEGHRLQVGPKVWRSENDTCEILGQSSNLYLFCWDFLLLPFMVIRGCHTRRYHPSKSSSKWSRLHIRIHWKHRTHHTASRLSCYSFHHGNAENQVPGSQNRLRSSEQYPKLPSNMGFIGEMEVLETVGVLGRQEMGFLWLKGRILSGWSDSCWEQSNWPNCWVQPGCIGSLLAPTHDASVKWRWMVADTKIWRYSSCWTI